MPKSGYLSTLRRPGILPVLAAGVLGRLTFGIVPFASVVAISTAHGFAIAGIATALFLTANAVLSPARGRIVDRRGAATLLAMALAYITALVATALLLQTPAWLAAVGTLTAAGAVSPPIGPALRTSWSRLASNKDDLQQIHALDSVIEELTFVIAPLLTTALLVTIAPQWCLVVGAVLLLPAAAGIHRYGRLERTTESSPNHDDRPVPSTSRTRSLMWGPTAQGIVTPIATLGAVGGGVTLLITALADQAGNIGHAGYAFAAYSLGGAIAGLIYGRLRWNVSLRRKYAIITAYFALAIAVLIPADSLLLTMIAVFLAGAGLTPMFVVAYLLVDERIEASRLTEANSWLSSGYNIGSAGGAALCGWLVSQTSATAVAIIFTGIAVIGVLGSLRIPRQTRVATDEADEATELSTT